MDGNKNTTRLLKGTGICLSIIFFTLKGGSQNLVQNGNWEQFTACPSNVSQTNLAIPWINPCDPPYGSSGTASGSSDYFNVCATASNCSVPSNALGYQLPNSGNGYAGLFVYFFNDYREYVEASFSSPLVANQCYELTLYANLANISRYAVDTIGIYFSNTLITGLHMYTPLPYTPQLKLHPGFISDTLNWMPVSATFTASGGESYMIIGNFSNNANTNFVQVSTSVNAHSYIYIDDVCLAPCGNSCVTGIEEHHSDNVTCYPNPVADILHIQNTTGKITGIRIIDAAGRTIINQSQELIESYQVNIENLMAGIYFIEISDELKIVRKKIVKQ
jgi:hypothetical protein